MKSSRRTLLQYSAALSPALVAAQPTSSATSEAEKAKATVDANRKLLRQVKLRQSVEPAFSFKP